VGVFLARHSMQHLVSEQKLDVCKPNIYRYRGRTTPHNHDK
jgi:hypothetical protein